MLLNFLLLVSLLVSFLATWLFYSNKYRNEENNYWVWGTVCVAFYSTAVLLFGAFMGTTVYDPDAREDSKAIGWTGAAFLLISTVGSHVWKIVFQKPEPGATSVNNLIF